MKQLESAVRFKTMEAQGWELLRDLLMKANLTEEQWFSVNLALGFSVTAEKDTIAERLEREQSL